MGGDPVNGLEIGRSLCIALFVTVYLSYGTPGIAEVFQRLLLAGQRLTYL